VLHIELTLTQPELQSLVTAIFELNVDLSCWGSLLPSGNAVALCGNAWSGLQQWLSRWYVSQEHAHDYQDLLDHGL